MKKPFYQILSYLCVITFFLHWVVVFILAMPNNGAKKAIINNAPRFQTIFVSWKLFTPPYKYNNRLYFIVRDIARPDRSDTIEVLANISLQKHYKAPFNQKENVIDHLVNHDVASIKSIVWQNKKKPTGIFPGKADSLYIATAVADVADSKSYSVSLATLNNYCKVVLKEKEINTIGKEIKIVITEKKIRPFKNMTDTGFLVKETVFFETPYNRISQ